MSTSLKGLQILVTGGAGMLGSTLASLCADQGAMVTVFDVLEPAHGSIPFNLQPVWERIRYVQGDICDRACLGGAVRGMDIIFHLAAQVSYTDSNTAPLQDMTINLGGTLNLLETCRLEAPAAKVVFSSSRFVYGRIDYSPVDEKHPFNCLSIYGIHKLAAEKYHRFYFDAHGLNTCCLRITNPYGPRQQMRHNKYGIVNWFIRQGLEGQPLTVYGDGSQIRDYIYIDDLATAFLRAALSQKTDGEVFNAGSGVGTAFKEMAREVARQTGGVEVKQVPWPDERYFVESGDFIADISRLHAATGWKPAVSLQEGIARTVAYYRENRSHYW